MKSRKPQRLGRQNVRHVGEIKKPVKHLIECHCVLPQYRDKPKTVYHKFVVFSILDESDTIRPKFVNCNNCGVLHRIFDLCRSEIVNGKEDVKTAVSIEDITINFSEKLLNIVERYKLDIATIEEINFYIENNIWGESIVLSKENIDSSINIKKMILISEDKFKIINETEQVFI